MGTLRALRSITAFLILWGASSAQATTTFADVYRTKVLRNLNSSQILQSNVKNKIRSACPTAPSTDLSTCLRMQLQAVEIKTASQALFLSTVATTAATTDQADGHSALTAAFLAADNLLYILEKIDTRKFLLNEIIVSSVEDYLSLVHLKREENKSIEATKTKLLNSVEQLLHSPAAQREPSTAMAPDVQVWQKNQFSRLSARYEAVKAANLQFPDRELIFNRGRVLNLLLRAQQRNICFNPRLVSCKEVSLVACEKIARDAYSVCDRKSASWRAQGAVTPTTGQVQAQDVQNYIQDLHRCAAPFIKQEFIKAAPSCH